MRLGLFNQPGLTGEHLAPDTAQAGAATTTNPPTQNVSPMEGLGPKIPLQQPQQQTFPNGQMAIHRNTLILIGLGVVVLYLVCKKAKAVAA